VFVERNFDMNPDQAHALWLKSPTPIAAHGATEGALKAVQDPGDGRWVLQGAAPNSTLLTSADFIRVERRPMYARLVRGGRVQRRHRADPGPRPGPEAVAAPARRRRVAAMAPHLASVAGAIDAIPDGRAVRRAGGHGRSGPGLGADPATQDSRTAAREALSTVICEGGQDNLRALVQAGTWRWKVLRAPPSSGSPARSRSLGEVEPLRQRLERWANGPVLYDLQVGIGPNAVSETLDGFVMADSLPSRAIRAPRSPRSSAPAAPPLRHGSPCASGLTLPAAEPRRAWPLPPPRRCGQ